MKKTLLIAVSAGILLFQSCKEIGPKIDFGPTGDDTAYLGKVETPQVRKILAEEFTGVSCPPCPTGHTIMKSIKDANNGNVVIIAYHIFNYPQSEPVVKNGDTISHYDFRTDDATDIGNDIMGGIGGMPLATFDRAKVGNDQLVNSPSWSGAADARKNKATPLNLHITSAYDPATKQATIKVTVAYTEEVKEKQNLTVAITQDSIVDAQKTLTDVVKDYVHEHVLRDVITPIYGSSLSKADPKVAGKTYERTFKVTVPDEWHVEHCNVVAFVTNDEAGDHHVVNAEEVKMNGQ